MPRFCFVAALLLLLPAAGMFAQEAPSMGEPPRASHPAPVERPEDVPPPPPAAAVPQYDPVAFEKPIPRDQLQWIAQYDGAPARDLLADKRFHKLLGSIVPNCTFHYGRDRSLDEALAMVMENSRVPVRVRDGRYLLVSGMSGPFLAGRGFIWVDLQEGVGLGGFYFTPTNGEPSPSLVVFSRQVRDEVLDLGALPAAFAQDTAEWAAQANVPAVTTRYFITGSNKRVLLEHDEDFCAPTDGRVADNDCEQQNADAADRDVTAAYYLDQVHYATNATAWMLGPDQVAFLSVRDRTCGGIADPFACRIRLDRERTRVILHRPPGVVHPRPGTRSPI